MYQEYIILFQFQNMKLKQNPLTQNSEQREKGELGIPEMLYGIINGNIAKIADKLDERLNDKRKLGKLS